MTSLQRMSVSATPRRLCALLCSLFLFTSAPAATASNFTLRIGPPNLGTGGSNPVGLPPSGLDYELGYTFQSGLEMNLAISPGLLVGYRNTLGPGVYTSFGGGILISANGVGPGVYAAFGADVWCGWVCFNIEYKQTAGITSGSMISPYALRIGVSTWF